MRVNLFESFRFFLGLRKVIVNSVLSLKLGLWPLKSDTGVDRLVMGKYGAVACAGHLLIY